MSSILKAVGSFLASLVTKKEAQKASPTASDLLTLVRSFNWVVGHQKSLNALAQTVHRLKQERVGGIIVLAGERQQGTKAAIVAGLAQAWTVASTSTAFGELCADDYSEGSTELVSASIMEWEDSKVVRVSSVTDNTPMLHCLSLLRALITENGFLVILEVDRAFEKPKSAIGKLAVDELVSLLPQEEALEAALQKSWKAFAPRERELTGDEVMRGKNVLSKGDTSVGVVQHILRLVERIRLQNAEETPTDAKRPRVDVPSSNTTSTTSISDTTSGSVVSASAPAATSTSTSASHNNEEVVDSYNSTTVINQALEPRARDGGTIPDWIGEAFAQTGSELRQQREEERQARARPSSKIFDKVKKTAREVGMHDIAATAVFVAGAVWGEKTAKNVRTAFKEGIATREEMKEYQAQRSKKRKAIEGEEGIVQPTDNPPLPSAAAELPPPLPLPLPLPPSPQPSQPALLAPSTSMLQLPSTEPLIQDVEDDDAKTAPSTPLLLPSVEPLIEGVEGDEDDAPAPAAASLASID